MVVSHPKKNGKIEKQLTKQILEIKISGIMKAKKNVESRNRF